MEEREIPVGTRRERSRASAAGVAADATDACRTTFASQVRDALNRLYDPAYLQTHPLVALVSRDPASRGAGAGKALRQLIIDAIDALRPMAGRGTPAPAGLIHQILTLRYVDALEPAVVQERLAIGRSEYYREYQRGTDALISLLWERRNASCGDVVAVSPAATSSPSAAVEERAVTLPAASSETRSNHNLPAQLTSFVGRAVEARVVEALVTGSRLLTLTGTGGCGKTRLALEVASHLVASFVDGVWLVELAPLVDPSLVAQAIATVLGIREEAAQPIQATLLRALRARTMLIILDNCEHLIDACARLADAIVRSCPGVRVLVTSREPLGIEGEVAWRVPSLPIPLARAHQQPSDLAQNDSVRLFVERVHAVQPGFQLTGQNAGAVAQICRRLDGIPLALELAASRVRTLPIEQVAARLDQRFRLLTGGSRAALPRHQTLAALVAWSYELLTEQERALFERLAVFSGGFTAEAAQAVCIAEGVDEWDVLDHLGRLVDKSLVIAESGDGRIERYHQLETLRQFGQEKLVARGDATVTRRRHADYFAAFAEEAAPKQSGPDWPIWVRRLDTEHDNLRHALTWAVGLDGISGADPIVGLRLVGALGRYWATHSHYVEACVWSSHALAQTPNAPPSLRCLAVLTAAQSYYLTDDHAAAEPLANEALRLARLANNERQIALSTWLLGLIARFEGGNLERAEGLVAEARRIFEEQSDLSLAWLTIVHLGRIALFRKDHQQAEQYLQQARVIQRQIGSSESHAEQWLGSVAYDRGDLDRAALHYAEALAMSRRSDNRPNAGWSLANLGMVAHARGDHDSAVAYYRESLQIYEDIGYLNGISDVFQRLAKVAASREDYNRAARLMGAAAALPYTIGSLEPPFEHETYDRCVADVRAALGEAAFSAAFAAGHEQPLETTVAAVLADEAMPT
jgi:non-specific serine/threonine protein kinase